MKTYSIRNGMLIPDPNGDLMKAQEWSEYFEKLSKEVGKSLRDDRFHYGDLVLDRKDAQVLWDTRDLRIVVLENGVSRDKNFVTDGERRQFIKAEFWKALEEYL